MPVRILIVDDHEIVREGIKTLITRSRPEWEICGEASDGERAIEGCKTLNPDVVILDITMPGLSGLEAASKMAALGLGCRVLMFTMHESERLSGEVHQAGAQGLVLKSQAARDLIRAIDSLLAGGTFFGSESAPAKNPLGHLPPKSTAESSIRIRHRIKPPSGSRLSAQRKSFHCNGILVAPFGIAVSRRSISIEHRTGPFS